MRCERGRTLDIEPRWWGCARIGGSHQRLSPPVERVCRILTLPASPDEGLERQPVCSHRMHRNRDNKVRTNKASRLTADTTQKLRHTTKHVQTKWRPFCKSRVICVFCLSGFVSYLGGYLSLRVFYRRLPSCVGLFLTLISSALGYANRRVPALVFACLPRTRSCHVDFASATAKQHTRGIRTTSAARAIDLQSARMVSATRSSTRRASGEGRDDGAARPAKRVRVEKATSADDKSAWRRRLARARALRSRSRAPLRYDHRHAVVEARVGGAAVAAVARCAEEEGRRAVWARARTRTDAERVPRTRPDAVEGRRARLCCRWGGERDTERGKARVCRRRR